MALKSEQVHPKASDSQGFTDWPVRFDGARSSKPAAGEIVILCPRTSTPVTTGLRIDWVVFRSLPSVAVPLRCPACGLIHRWKPEDAWIGTDT
jgi:hypothetical protein